MTLAWSLVFLGGVVWFSVVWLWLREPRWLRLWLALIVPTWSIAPAPVEGYAGEYAPAVIVAVYESLFAQDGNPGTAIAVLVMGTVLLSLGVLAVHFAEKLMLRRSSEANADEDQ